MEKVTNNPIKQGCGKCLSSVLELCVCEDESPCYRADRRSPQGEHENTDRGVVREAGHTQWFIDDVVSLGSVAPEPDEDEDNEENEEFQVVTSKIQM